MTRDIDLNVETELESSNFRWCLLLRLDFDAGTLFLHSGNGTISFDGDIYLGIGALGQISGVVEKADGGDNRIKVSLCPIPKSELSNLVDEVTTSDSVGRPYKLFYAVLDANAVIIGTPITMSSGTMDEVNLSDGEEAILTMDLVSDAALLKRRTVFKLTNQHQQQLFANDLGLAFINDLGQEIRWGSAPKTTVGGVGGGGGRSGSGREDLGVQRVPL